ncbi:MAG TPA: helix-turn-helix domain-containing protein [Dermatophilaceae bacterium]|nr:helix-turn-helix domain-containing protein [Dermatophilaceae bacterium]
MRQIMSTESVPQPDRLDYWHEVVRRTLWPLQVQVGPRRKGDYRGTVHRDVCDGLEVTTVTADSQTVRHTSAQAAGVPTDRVVLGLQLDGPGVLRQDGRECRLAPGEATLFDPSRGYFMGFAQEFSLAVFSLPRALVTLLCGDLRATTARPLRPATLSSRGALSYLSCVASVSTGTGLTDGDLASGTLGVVASLLREGPVLLGGHQPPDDLHRRAVAFIDTHIHEPGLTPDDVAAACHVSRRQLYRLFATMGSSVAETIRDRRVLRARALLESAPATTPMGWVGARVGFGSPEQFSRVFRQRSGMSPSRWRDRVQTGAPSRSDGGANQAEAAHAGPPRPDDGGCAQSP